jgi:hypothetical protein
MRCCKVSIVMQEEFERWILRIIAIGALLSIIEFFAIGILIEGGGLAGFHSGLMAGIIMIIITVILVFFITAFMKPDDTKDAE